MPARLRRPLGVLGQHAAATLSQQPPQRQLAWTQATLQALRANHPRPWSRQTPELSQLGTGDDAGPACVQRLVQLLQRPPSDGFAALAAVAALRELYLATESLGIGASTLPFVAQATGFYARRLSERSGQLPGLARPRPLRSGVGLTAYHAASPVDLDWTTPAHRACHRVRPDLGHPHVREALAYGNPYGSGVSATTSLFLFAAGSLARTTGYTVEPAALVAVLAATSSYDGEHSFHESFAAALATPVAWNFDLGPLRCDRPGYARAFFIELVDPADAWLRNVSLRRLAAFLLAHPTTPPAVRESQVAYRGPELTCVASAPAGDGRGTAGPSTDAFVTDDNAVGDVRLRRRHSSAEVCEWRPRAAGRRDAQLAACFAQRHLVGSLEKVDEVPARFELDADLGDGAELAAAQEGPTSAPPALPKRRAVIERAERLHQ